MFRTVEVPIYATGPQRDRLFGLLEAAGDVRACAIELAQLHLRRGEFPPVRYMELTRLLAESGPGTFGELDTTGARSVLKAWSTSVAESMSRKRGGQRARWPWRRKRLIPVTWYRAKIQIEERRSATGRSTGGVVRIPTAKGSPPLWVRFRHKNLPYELDALRSVRLRHAGDGRLVFDLAFQIGAPVPVKEPSRVAGVDLGEIHPYAVASGDDALVVSGRALRAERHLHHLDRKKRSRATARRAPSKGQRGSRRWRKARAKARKVELTHARRIEQARREAARTTVDWAVEHGVDHLVIGDPTGVLKKNSGRRHNRRMNAWAPGRHITALEQAAERAGVSTEVVDERGTSSTCPACSQRVPKPRGRNFACPHCGLTAHRDVVGATNITTRNTRNTTTPSTPMAVVPTTVTHRRTGTHLPGVVSARRDPRRPAPRGPAPRSTWPVKARPSHPSG